MRFWKKQK